MSYNNAEVMPVFTKSEIVKDIGRLRASRIPRLYKSGGELVARHSSHLKKDAISKFGKFFKFHSKIHGNGLYADKTVEFDGSDMYALEIEGVVRPIDYISDSCALIYVHDEHNLMNLDLVSPEYQYRAVKIEMRGLCRFVNSVASTRDAKELAIDICGWFRVENTIVKSKEVLTEYVDLLKRRVCCHNIRNLAGDGGVEVLALGFFEFFGCFFLEREGGSGVGVFFGGWEGKVGIT